MVKQALADLGLEIEAFLGGCMKGRHVPCALVTAMEYSLMAGGKRLRPALCLTFAELFGLARGEAMPFACALECIHTYSLIHDDLPAMDDDDLRRGKPSSHKKFGEATAILAGDGLLTEAFGIMTWVAEDGSGDGTVPPARVVAALRETASAAGAAGMVGGQFLDMDFTGRRTVKLDELRAMHALKTGALIRCSCLTGAILAGASEEDLARVRAYGEAIGVAFQIVDDVLDVVGDEATLGKPVGSDASQGKCTYPALVGIEKSREMARERADAAQEILAPYAGPQADFLRALARYIVERAS
ncbi:MAG: polyprenyl synthetase family protein [Desulfovibrionaceae bacterium]|nr:polyprenyl synthetase family protein [Desulfovibrionaceae bacterium]